MTRHKKLVIATATASCALLAFGVGAAAASGLQTRTASITVAPIPAFGTATPACSKGKKVVSGGFDNPGFNYGAGGAALFPYSSHKSGGRTWTVSAQNGNLASGTLIAYAYCKKGGGTTTRSASTTVPSGPPGVATATARCPSGQKAIAGGVDNPGFSQGSLPHFLPYISVKSGGRSWTVAAANLSPSPQTLTTFVYCRKGKGLKTRSGNATAGGAGSDVGTATAQCKSNEILVSGGYSNPIENLFPAGPSFRYYSSHKLGSRGWTVSAYNEGSTAGTFTAFAYCEKNRA
jgi:hypothetical protein